MPKAKPAPKAEVITTDSDGVIIELARPEAEAPEGQPLEADIAQPTVDLAAETLTGDLRTFLLDRLRRMPKPWEQMTEIEQGNLIDQTDAHASYVVREACNIMASAGRYTAPAILETFKQKGGDVTVQLDTIATPDTIVALSQACGGKVQLVFVHAEQFAGERKAEQPEPDQPALFDQTPTGEGAAAEGEPADAE